MVKKRLKVEVLLAAAASPVPPPIDDLLPDLALRDEVSEDLPWLVRLLPRADVYLQDEVEIALHPTLRGPVNSCGKLMFTSRPGGGGMTSAPNVTLSRVAPVE